MLGNKANVTRWENPRVDGEALPKWSSWCCGSVKQGLWPEEMTPSQTGCSPQLPVATGGQGSLPFKIISATTAALTVTCLFTLQHYCRMGFARPESLAEITLQGKWDATHCLRARQQQHWCLDTGRRAGLPNNYSLITHMDTHSHQYPRRVLPNSSTNSSKLDTSLRCGRSHWLPLAAAPLLPALPRNWGTRPRLALQLCHRTLQGQVPVFPQEQLEETNRKDVPCATLYSYPASFPNTCVQKVP